LIVAGVVGLERAARTIGAWCWAERRCFELLGGWVHDTPEPALKALFARHSRHHAWRAERWAEILPRAYVPPVDELIAAGPGAEAFDLAGTVGPSARRLVAHYDVVYPAVVSAYESSPAGMHPVTDGPALRAIRIIVGDARHDLEEAASVRQRLIGGTSEPTELVHLREAVASSQVSEVVEGMPIPLFRRWGS
jgi:hypothetical protein